MCAVFSAEDKSRVLDQCRKKLAEQFSFDHEQSDRLLADMPDMVESAAHAIGLHVEQQPDFEQVLRETNVRLAESNLDYQDLTWRLEKAIRERDELAAELSRELEVAAEIQKSLLPRDGGKDFPITGINLSARELSGDFFDFFELEDGRIYFCLGDVSGKGITAALLMAKTCSLFRCLGKQNDSPGNLLGIINNEICETSVRGMFVTLIAGVYDPLCGSLVVVNAGSPPALLFSDKEELRKIESDGPPLGIVQGFEYPEVSLGMRGASLYLYSDGVTEGYIKENEELGEENLVRLLGKVRSRLPGERLQAIVQCFTSSQMPQRDDITLLVVEDRFAGYREMMNYRFKAAPEELKDMRTEVIKSLQRSGCSSDFGKRMVIAVNEACMNIIQHAYSGDSEGEIIVEILNNGKQLVFRIIDFAEPIDASCVKSRDLEDIRPGGLGVHFMHEVMDHTHFLDKCGKAGNILEMTKNLE
jgi:sigma-B regulation protein RsbU (phosphoserine phosphatase)